MGKQRSTDVFIYVLHRAEIFGYAEFKN